MQLNKQKHAFSLIELSISVVIISIIIAAITTGASLQKQAQIRTIASEFSLIQAAISSFKLQYNYLPGDIPSATTLWPSATTVNGNGNNMVEFSGSNVEDTYVFQHLYLAGIIPTQFSGGVLSPRYIIGQNIYPSKVNKAGHALLYDTFYSYTGQLVEYGLVNSSTGLRTNYSIFSATDSYQLDLKIDDGVPNTGKIFTTYGADQSSGKCVNGSYAYILTSSSVVCRHILVIE